MPWEEMTRGGAAPVASVMVASGSAARAGHGSQWVWTGDSKGQFRTGMLDGYSRYLLGVWGLDSISESRILWAAQLAMRL
jgi:hypothetical protein